MTAFANGETEIDNLTINCELRSVNHRYCDITLKLPERLRFSETDLRVLIASELKRGKIDCSLNYKKQSNGKQIITVNEEAVKALLRATSQIEDHMHSQQAFSALEVLNFPGIQQEPESDKDELLRGINRLVESTIKQLIIAREREGLQLGGLIEERCQKVLLLVDAAKKRLPIVLEQIREKIKLRITELVTSPDLDRLEQEMIFLVQKLDVAEEIDRLDTHIQEVLNVLTKNEPIGRRLDFLMQELHREANTLGSKSADKQMSQISIDLKVLIEQMREQIQNIE